MVRRKLVRALPLAIAFFALAPATVLAQSAISGTVRDTSSAVLPGVTVEAASPALIEKTRAAVTDSQGLYRLVDLRPGVYTVTFSLPGFSTVRREGLELPDAFTATVNAELSVGSVEETITVTGESPIVDVQNAAQRQLLSKELTDALPSGRTVQSYLMYLPGVTGPTLGAVTTDTRAVSIHGSRTGTVVLAIDGISTNFARQTSGTPSSFFINQAIAQETSVQTGGASAEQQWGGIVSNIIPKEGSNSFSGYFYGSYSAESLQSDNLSDELKANGLPSVNKNLKLFDINPAGGGRILRDKVWFYSAARYAGIDRSRAGIYYDTDPLDWVYTPDLSRQHHSGIVDLDYSLRLTWQVTPKNKVMLFFDQQPHFVQQRGGEGSNAAPEATSYTAYWPNAIYNVTWKSPVSNRFLLEAIGSAYVMEINQRAPRDPLVPWGIVPAREQRDNRAFRAGNYFFTVDRSARGLASASYITGSHAVKVGLQYLWGALLESSQSYDYSVSLLNGTPRSLTQIVKPQDSENHVIDIGLYVQDQWTYKRATLNYGLRVDNLRGSVPTQELAAGPYVSARSYPALKNVPNYKDLSPRFGISYDLFGDGKTALKATANRYIGAGGVSIPRANNFVNLSVLSVNRDWNDANRDYIPNCDLANPLANGECLQVSDLNFGKTNPRNLGYDSDLLGGWGIRSGEWETTAQLQRQVTSSISLNVGYFHRAYFNFTTTDNLLVGPADYSEYCVTAPVHAGLPAEVSGAQLCGLYDVNLNKFGRVQTQVTSTDKFGKESETWHGVDVTFTGRVSGGGTFTGGVSTGRAHLDTCAVVDSPQKTRFCDNLQPFLSNYKLLGHYPLPWWGVELSGVLQNLAGQPLTATAVYTRAQVRPSLGRDLTTSTVTVDLMAPSTEYLPRRTQVDLRVAKTIRYQRARLTASLDLFNLFNGNSIERFNNRIGPTWPTPTQIQPARFVGLNVLLNF